AGIGSVMPTLLEIVGERVPETPQKSLFSPDPLGLVDFHKSAFREKWGLRDGKWKYIAEMRGDSKELYDLDADPREQTNLVNAHPEMVAEYDSLLPVWYLTTDKEYRSHLLDYTELGRRSLTVQDIASRGPKILGFGHKNRGTLKEDEIFRIGDSIIAWTQWVPYGKSKTIIYELRSPTGKITKFTFVVKGHWTSTNVDL